ncbi:MAG: ABC transporter substrate-binding protein [bacterium]|nr:ABC transporter substrate-binding protein [bacterium]
MNPLSGKIVKFLSKFKNFALNLGLSAKQARDIFRGGQGQADLDKKLVFSLAKSRWPSFKQLKYLKKYLTRAERLVIIGCLSVIFISLTVLAAGFYKNHLSVIPVNGGDYTEGAIGLIKYINPLYSSVSDTDGDIAELVYSSLFKRGLNAELVNDLAESYEAAPDGKSYAIKIRPDAVWQNGAPLTADDIVFTFEAIKNVQYKSPLRTAFIGVEIEKTGDHAIKFNLAEPYAAFLDLLNFGILPQAQWRQIEPSAASLAELNLKPIGSGRYKFKSLVKDKSGNIRAYSLARNENYYGSRPRLDTFNFKFFVSLEEAISALNNNLIDGLAYLPEQEKAGVVAQDSLNFYNLNLPKLSAVFFNTKASAALTDKKVRQALAYAIDKKEIIKEVMASNARLIDGPILPGNFAFNDEIKKYDYDLATSTRLLEEAGWTTAELTEQDITQAREYLDQAEESEAEAEQDEQEIERVRLKLAMGAGRWLIKNNDYLVIELTTVDNEEYGNTAALIAEFWSQIGVKTKLNLVAASQIQPGIIRPRKFSALLFGEITGADPDPYVFWHSSQIGQSGLNLADYANKEADKLLEDGRLSNDPEVRREKYKKFQEIIAEDEPAVFLYSPNYIYVQSKKIKGFGVTSIILPSDRFSGLDQWYVKTGKRIIW